MSKGSKGGAARWSLKCTYRDLAANDDVCQKDQNARLSLRRFKVFVDGSIAGGCLKDGAARLSLRYYVHE